jgi:hypothetical protein
MQNGFIFSSHEMQNGENDNLIVSIQMSYPGPCGLAEFPKDLVEEGKWVDATYIEDINNVASLVIKGHVATVTWPQHISLAPGDKLLGSWRKLQTVPGWIDGSVYDSDETLPF